MIFCHNMQKISQAGNINCVDLNCRVISKFIKVDMEVNFSLRISISFNISNFFVFLVILCEYAAFKNQHRDSGPLLIDLHIT